VTACMIWNGNSCIPTISEPALIQGTTHSHFRHNVIIDPGQTQSFATDGDMLTGVMSNKVIVGAMYVNVESAVFLDPPRSRDRGRAAAMHATQLPSLMIISPTV